MAEKAKNDQSSSVEVYELAGITQRFVANIIDNLVLTLPFLLLQFVISPPEQPLDGQLLNFIVLAIPVAYHWYFWTHRDGQTPGKFAMGIRVIKTDGEQLSDVDALIRAIGYHVSALLLGLGFFWAILDSKNQTWHDKMARTYVVRTETQRKTIEIDV